MEKGKVEQVTVAEFSDQDILYQFEVDPGDGDGILCYVDATPLDDDRRLALVNKLAVAPKLLETCRRVLMALERAEAASPNRKAAERKNARGHSMADLRVTINYAELLKREERG